MSELNKDLCEWVEAYMIRGLSEEEQQQFEQHLLGCMTCMEQVADYSQVVNLLPLASAEVQVPAGMKKRILGNILVNMEPIAAVPVNSSVITAVPMTDPNVKAVPAAAPSNRLGRLYRTVVTIGLSAAVIVLALYTAQLKQNVNDLKSQIALSDQPATALKLNEVVTLNPAAKDIVAQGLATIMIDTKGTHLIVQAEKLPELKGNQAFQVWLLKGGKPVNAGTFVSLQGTGTGALFYTFEPNGYDTIAITLEPDALGKAAPRGQVILAAKMKDTI